MYRAGLLKMDEQSGLHSEGLLNMDEVCYILWGSAEDGLT